MAFQALKMAWSSIISNKMRSFLTMLGIIIGVMALIVLVSVVDGATKEVTDVVTSLGTNLLSIQIQDDKGRPIRMNDLKSSDLWKTLPKSPHPEMITWPSAAERRKAMPLFQAPLRPSTSSNTR